MEVAASSSTGEGAHPRAGPASGGVPPSPASRPASAPSGLSPKDTRNSKQCLASNHIEQFKLDDDKSCFITGEPGTGKTYMCKELQQESLSCVDNINSVKYVHQRTNQLYLQMIVLYLICSILIQLIIHILKQLLKI